MTTPEEFFKLMDYNTKMKYSAVSVIRIMNAYKTHLLEQDLCKENIDIAYKLGIEHGKNERIN